MSEATCQVPFSFESEKASSIIRSGLVRLARIDRTDIGLESIKPWTDGGFSPLIWIRKCSSPEYQQLILHKKLHKKKLILTSITPFLHPQLWWFIILPRMAFPSKFVKTCFWSTKTKLIISGKISKCRQQIAKSTHSQRWMNSSESFQDVWLY